MQNTWDSLGFGDYRPHPENLLPVLLLVICGVIFTTVCMLMAINVCHVYFNLFMKGMDIVGRMYLKEIHFLGRKLQSNNPFYMLREAKAKLIRKKILCLLSQGAVVPQWPTSFRSWPRE